MSASSTDTDTSPVRTGWITVPTGAPGGDTMDAYLALPPAGRGPGLVLLQEIFGVNAHIRGVAEQYALAGFTVIAPDLFWRQGRRIELGYEGTDRERALALMKTVTRDVVIGDIQATVAALRARPECHGGIGAVGYCMGGRLAFFAAATAGIDAAVAYYGGNIAANLDLAPQVRCPIQFHHAGQDHAIPAEAVASIRQAMAGSAVPMEFHDYPSAQHGFNCWARATYHPASAALALGHSLSFLSRLFAD